MRNAKLCPKCGHLKSWSIRRERRRCAKCLYEWQPGRLPLRLSRAEWNQIIKFFLMDLSSQHIAEETQLERRRVIRALLSIRSYLAHDIPPELKPDVRFIPSGKKPNPEEKKRPKGPIRPLIGILAKEGKVWAELIPPEVISHFLPFEKKQVEPGAVISFNFWKHYAGVAIKGSLNRLSGMDGETKNPNISELENFWGFLKRKLSGKGGIRRHRLPLYLAEYNWRYNNRHKNLSSNIKNIFNLISENKFPVA